MRIRAPIGGYERLDIPAKLAGINFNLRLQSAISGFILFLALFFFASATLRLSAETATNLAQPKSALQLPAQPTEADIWNARVFDEPLIPIGGKPSPEETRELATALVSYASRTNSDDFSSLTGFLDAFPDCKWDGSLLLHLGVEYYNCGYYSKALNAWERSWKVLENVDDPRGKPQADRALGELARMYSKLGRMSELTALLQSAAKRSFTGPAGQLIRSAQDALWEMQHRPGFCFRCGPLALAQILSQKDPDISLNPVLLQSRSSTNGFSLAQVADLSAQAGLNYRMAYRSPGARLIVPAVVHWNVGHYAAVLAQNEQRYLVKDHTFHSSLWMTLAAINAESSGYFLVPPGDLPVGWRVVGTGEGAQVWGRGVIESRDPNQTGSTATQCGGQCLLSGGTSFPGMTTYTMNTMLASLCLRDTPLGYAPPVGPPIRFSATYNQNDANQAATFYYSNLGPDWTCNWISYITDDPQASGADVTFYDATGGTLTFSSFDSGTLTYAPELMTQAILRLTSSSSYEMQFPTGAKEEFTASDGSTGTSRRIFLTQIIDSAGNSVQLRYDSSLKLTNVVDAIGQVTTFAYTNTSFPYAITMVTDPFGRSTSLQYNSAGLLTQMTDVLGLNSQYVYGSNDFVTALITPYGTTAFSSGSTNGVTYLQATDPLGASELIEATQNPVIPDSEPTGAVPAGMEVINEFLSDRNSFFWDKRAFDEAPGDYTKATVYHFLHNIDTTEESGVLESIKQPLENRVWYNYPGMASLIVLGAQTINKPTAIGRVLDNGSSQTSYYQYNLLGLVTNSTDPVGRSFSYVYSTNNVDLLQVFMTSNGRNELQSTATYNSQHRPLTITDASGQTMTNTYNSRSQILSTADPLGETTTFAYTTNGYLLSVTGPLQNSNDVVSFSYDGFGRVQTATDTEGYTLTYAYDAADRVTNITHPDGTYEQFVYSNLDLVASADRLGRWTTNAYDADRQLTSTRDPLGRVTIYEWCRCGALSGLIDPMGRRTSWDYDVQSRRTAKHYADGSTITYVYENTTSRLNSRFDEGGQQTVYQYNLDDTFQSVSYPNATVATPTVTFTYDPDYKRVLTMQDGVGTTTYSYNPITAPPALGAGRLASFSGPLPNSLVAYEYDQLGRVTNRAINGVVQTTAFDVLGRPILVTNALGTFQYAYVDATARLASEAYPNGQTNLFTYYNNFGDERLSQITHLYPNGSLLSSFGYAYDPVGQIIYWTNQTDATPARYLAASYDTADQLTNAVLTDGVTTFNSYAYAYDQAGNRLQSQINGATTLYSYNSLNQLTAAVPVQTNSPSYQWDAEHRLVSVLQGTNTTQFTYDGLGRRVQVVELTNGVVQSDNRYLWCGARICEVRDVGGGNVLRRLFSHGESLAGTPNNTNYYYTEDHLGSVREAVGSDGVLVTRYNYDPFGQKSVLQESFQTTFGFTGDFVHQKTGLYLTWFRALDSTSGRWLSRDPLDKLRNVNLYSYVSNTPLNYVDIYGLCNNTDDQDNGWETGNVFDFPGGDFSVTTDTNGVGTSTLTLGEGFASGSVYTTTEGNAGLCWSPGGHTGAAGGGVSVCLGTDGVTVGWSLEYGRRWESGRSKTWSWSQILR